MSNIDSNWSLIDISINEISKEKLIPYKLCTLLNVSESSINENISCIRNLILSNKIQPYNNVLVFTHKMSYMALYKSTEHYNEFMNIIKKKNIL